MLIKIINLLEFVPIKKGYAENWNFRSLAFSICKLPQSYIIILV